MKMRLKTYKMAMSILLKFLTLKWDISRTIWRIEVGDGSFFCIFHTLSIKRNFVFDLSFPLIVKSRSKDVAIGKLETEGAHWIMTIAN